MNSEPLHEIYTGINVKGNAKVEIKDSTFNFHGDSINKQPQFTDEEVEQGIILFLEAVERNFNSLKLFHTRQEVPLLKQYIPIRVTLERKFTHEVERIGEYRETELELRDIYALKGGREEENEVTVEDWQKAKKDHNRIIVLADPGMGKSTLLRMEAVTIAHKEFDSLLALKVGVNLTQSHLKREENLVFPLLFRLSDLAESEGELIDLIPQLVERDYRDLYQVISRILGEKLVQGNCVLLLDALDEVPKEKRIKLGEKLTRFLKGNNCRVIVTSRIVGYGGGFLEQGKEMEIVPFTAKQTEEYIQTWFINAVGYLEDNSVSAQGLIEELKNKPQIQGLAQNPLLLSLLCSLYQTKGLILLARRSQVYEKAVDYMLRQWSVDNKRHHIEESWIDAKKELLEFLAYEFSDEGKEVFLLRELRQKIDAFLKRDFSSDFRDTKATDLIMELTNQDGIIQKLSREGDQYLFLHRTFQEYFTACYLRNASNTIELARQYFWNYDWHDTLSLLAGLLSDPSQLIQTITQEKDDIFKTQLLLKAKCIIECREIKYQWLENTFDEIHDLWQRFPGLDFIKYPIIDLCRTSIALLDKLDIRKQENIDLLSSLPYPEAIKKINLLISDSDWRVKDNANCSLLKLKRPKVYEGLQQIASDDNLNKKRNKKRNKKGKKKMVGSLSSTQDLESILKNGDFDIKYETILIICLQCLQDKHNIESISILIKGLILSIQYHAFEIQHQIILTLNKIGSLEVLEELLKLPKDIIYSKKEIFSLTQKLAIRHSKTQPKPNFIPVYPDTKSSLHAIEAKLAEKKNNLNQSSSKTSQPPPPSITYDLRGATIANLAHHVQGDQQTSQNQPNDTHQEK